MSGTFNPPTRAHVALAAAAAEQLGLDEVLFVLPEVPPHKGRLEASLEDRAAMLLLALGEEQAFSAAISSAGLFLDIHGALQPHYPAATRVVFLAGRDAAERILLHWPYADPQQALAEMFARFELAVAERGGGFILPADCPAEKHRRHIHVVKLPRESELVSATRARLLLEQGKAPGDCLAEAVAHYIAERRLYLRSS